MSDTASSLRSDAGAYRIGDWTLCARTNRLRRAAETVELERRLVHVLLLLIARRGAVVDRDTLLAEVWAGRTVGDDSVAVAISRLRKALGDDSRVPAYIRTVPGAGYQLVAEAGPMKDGRRPWRLAAGLAAALLAGAGLWFAMHAPSPDTILSRAEARIAAGRAVDLKAAIAELRPLAEGGNARAFMSLADAKLRLMADAVAVPANCSEVLGLLDRAIALDGRDGRAFMLRGDVRFLCRHDFAGADADFRRAVVLAPGDDGIRLRYSGLLLAQGRFDAAATEIAEARRLNPLNYSVPSVVWAYQMQRRDDLAYAEIERLRRAGADDRAYHVSASRVLARTGRADEAFASLLWLMGDARMPAADIAAARRAYAAGGLPAVNGWLLDRKVAADLGQYGAPLSRARYALAAGRTAEALDLLEQAQAAHQIPLLWAAVDPAYDAVRAEPRFQAIVAANQRPMPPA